MLYLLLTAAIPTAIVVWKLFISGRQYEDDSVMKSGSVGFRILYALYSGTPLGSWYTKRALTKAKLKYPDGHSLAKTFEYGDLRILPIPVNLDNITYLIFDSTTSDCVLVDVSDTETIVTALKSLSLNPTAILTTHKHWDHSCGNKDMKLMYPEIKIYGSQVDNPSGVTNRIVDGEEIVIGSLHFPAHVLPGHTRGHTMYRLHGNDEHSRPDSLFTGDLLFLAGLGKMFECSPKTMLQSLEKLNDFGEDSLIWPGHEYALENLQFAKHFDVENEAVRNKKQWVKMQREQRQPTCPSTLAEERSYNPFLRTDDASLLRSLQLVDDGYPLPSPVPFEMRVQALKMIRNRKDAFGSNGGGSSKR